MPVFVQSWKRQSQDGMDIGEKQTNQKGPCLQNNLILQGSKLQKIKCDLNRHIEYNWVQTTTYLFYLQKAKKAVIITPFDSMIWFLCYLISQRLQLCVPQHACQDVDLQVTIVVEPAGFQLQSTSACRYMPDRVAVQIRKHLFMPQNPQHIFPAMFPVLSSMPLQLSGSQLSHCFLV